MIHLNKIKSKLKRWYALKIERLPYIHWFNPIQTFYVNLKCFPFRQAIKFPLFIYGWTRLYSLYGTMECIGTCKTGMIKFNRSEVDAPGYASGHAELNLWGKIIFRGSAEVCASTKIMIGDKGILDLDNKARIMHQCIITAYKYIKIGVDTRITHKVQIMDSNFHYIADFSKRTVSDTSREIHIGNKCWICNSTTINGGAVIPDRTIVGSNSLVNKDFSNIPEGTVLGGIPAKVICNNKYRVFNEKFEQEINLFFENNTNEFFFKIPDHYTEQDA